MNHQVQWPRFSELLLLWIVLSILWVFFSHFDLPLRKCFHPYITGGRRAANPCWEAAAVRNKTPSLQKWPPRSTTVVPLLIKPGPLKFFKKTHLLSLWKCYTKCAKKYLWGRKVLFIAATIFHRPLCMTKLLLHTTLYPKILVVGRVPRDFSCAAVAASKTRKYVFPWLRFWMGSADRFRPVTSGKCS